MEFYILKLFVINSWGKYNFFIGYQIIFKFFRHTGNPYIGVNIKHPVYVLLEIQKPHLCIQARLCIIYLIQ